jgi:hypothetical protein
VTLPEFVCVGAQKSATSWLARTLQEHPQVWVPPIGEPHFFDRRGRHHRSRVRVLLERARAADPALHDYADRVLRHPTVSLEWYHDVFADPGGRATMRADITPAYLGLPEAAVSSARALLGDVPVLVVVRRPLDRELSQLRMWATRRAGGLRPPRSEDEWMARYDLMVDRAPRGGYAVGIPAWQNRFSRVLVLPFGDVQRRPAELVAAVEDHLRLPHHDGYSHLHTKVHRSRRADVPAPVVARARSRVEADDAYLREQFGDEFFDRTA